MGLLIGRKTCTEMTEKPEAFSCLPLAMNNANNILSFCSIPKSLFRLVKK